MKIVFSQQIFGNYMSNWLQIRAVRAEMFHADRQTEKYDGASSRFSQIFESA